MRFLPRLQPLVAVTIALALAASPIATARVSPTHGSDRYSIDQEIQLGQQTAAPPGAMA